MADERPLENGWLVDTPVGDTLLRRFVCNQADVNEALAGARGGRWARTDDVAMVDAGDVAVYLDQALLLRPLRDAADPVLDEVAAFYAGRAAALLVSIWPTPDLRPRGWELVGHPAFVARAPAGDGASLAPPRDGVRVGRVTSAEELRTFERVMIEGYPMPPAGDGAPTFADAVLGGPVMLRVAYVDGEPAGAGAAHVGHGVVNLCMAATLDNARRRGAWQALVAARVADDPTLPAVAFTSDDSRPGFVRMGFLPITRFTLWVVPPRS